MIKKTRTNTHMVIHRESFYESPLIRLPGGPPGPPPLPIPIRGLCLGCFVGGLLVVSSSSSFVAMFATALPLRRLLAAGILDGAELGACRFDNKGVVLGPDAPVCEVWEDIGEGKWGGWGELVRPGTGTVAYGTIGDISFIGEASCVDWGLYAKELEGCWNCLTGWLIGNICRACWGDISLAREKSIRGWIYTQTSAT